MQVTIEKPEIITLLYLQEKTDEDYGSCIWARFYLDTKNYTMTIESDCGNYTHGWYPTPRTESFLHLLCRLGTDYLLGKISNRSVIDGASTYDSIKEIITELANDNDAELDDCVWDDLQGACYHQTDIHDVIDGVSAALERTELWGEFDTYPLWECVSFDYPAGAKKIVDVFQNCIKPKLREIIKGEED